MATVACVIWVYEEFETLSVKITLQCTGKSAHLYEPANIAKRTHAEV